MNTIQSPQTAPRRPLIVTIIAILFFLAIPALLLSIYDALAVMGGRVPDVDPTSAYVQLAAAVVLLPLCAAIGWGLWHLREWARQLGAIALIVAITNVLLSSLRSLSLLSALMNTLAGSMIPIAVILLLYHPMTRAAFDAARARASDRPSRRRS